MHSPSNLQSGMCRMYMRMHCNRVSFSPFLSPPFNSFAGHQSSGKNGKLMLMFSKLEVLWSVPFTDLFSVISSVPQQLYTARMESSFYKLAFKIFQRSSVESTKMHFQHFKCFFTWHGNVSSPKNENCYHLLTLTLIQTCKNFFLLLKHKRRYFEECW